MIAEGVDWEEPVTFFAALPLAFPSEDFECFFDLPDFAITFFFFFFGPALRFHHAVPLKTIVSSGLRDHIVHCAVKSDAGRSSALSDEALEVRELDAAGDVLRK